MYDPAAVEFIAKHTRKLQDQADVLQLKEYGLHPEASSSAPPSLRPLGRSGVFELSGFLSAEDCRSLCAHYETVALSYNESQNIGGCATIWHKKSFTHRELLLTMWCRTLLAQLGPLVSDAFGCALDGDDFFAFIVDHRHAENSALEPTPLHVDESIFTLQVCLSCTDDASAKLIFGDGTEVQLTAGKTILHLGDSPHRTVHTAPLRRVSFVLYALPSSPIAPRITGASSAKPTPFYTRYEHYLHHKEMPPGGDAVFTVPTLPHYCRTHLKALRRERYPLLTIDETEEASEGAAVVGQSGAAVKFPLEECFDIFFAVIEFLSVDDRSSCDHVSQNWHRLLGSFWKQQVDREWEQARTKHFVNLGEFDVDGSSHNTSRSFISIGVGGFGCAAALHHWDTVLMESFIYPDGSRIPKKHFMTPFNSPYFSEISTNRYLANSILVDSDDEFLGSNMFTHWRRCLDHGVLCSPKGSATLYSQGRSALWEHDMEEAIRRQMERCSVVSGFTVYRGMSGGMGSGGGDAVLQICQAMKSKAHIVTVPIFPSLCDDVLPHTSSYNTLFAMGGEGDFSDVSFCFSSDALQARYQSMRRSSTPHPAPFQPSKHWPILNHMYSAATRGIRQGPELSSFLTSFDELISCHVPYPSLHSLAMSHVPLLPKHHRGIIAESVRTSEMVQTAFEADSFGIKMDPRSGKYMAVSLLFAGDVVPKDVMAAVASIKTKKDRPEFVDWCPTGLKCGIQYSPLVVQPGCSFQCVPRSLTLIANSTAIAEPFSRIRSRAEKLYSRRSFVHHYLKDGVEEGEFGEALERLRALEKDYEEVGAESIADVEVNANEY